MRNIPPIATFTEEVAHALGGSPAMLYPGEYPSAAIAFGDRHLILVRDHGWTLTLSLPIERSWQMQTREEWQAARDEIRAAVASSTTTVSMSDALSVISPELERITQSRWSIHFPGVPIPREAWARSGERSVGFFQEDDSVRIVIWSSDMAVRFGRSPSAFDDLGSWLEEQLGRQEHHLAAEEAEKRRKAALPLPDYDAVLAHLKSGRRITTTGGRYSETFFWDGDRLQRDIFDEGDSYVREGSEQDLRLHLRLYPDAFRKALGER
jgi:hypothetical protein